MEITHISNNKMQLLILENFKPVIICIHMEFHDHMRDVHIFLQDIINVLKPYIDLYSRKRQAQFVHNAFCTYTICAVSLFMVTQSVSGTTTHTQLHPDSQDKGSDVEKTRMHTHLHLTSKDKMSRRPMSLTIHECRRAKTIFLFI